MNIFNRTKIIATISSNRLSNQEIEKFIKAGVSVFRINSSHSNTNEIESAIRKIQFVINKLGVQVAILQDLQGPKIRIGLIENGEIFLERGQKLYITEKDLLGNSEILSVSYSRFIYDIKEGDDILVDDGKILLNVIKKFTDKVLVTVVHGGVLKSRKGINLPKTNLSSPSMTEKDKIDLMTGLKLGIEWVALSFVRNAKDILDLKTLIKQEGKNTKVVAKIEKPEAVKCVDDIIDIADALMVARGDLGVEIPMENVPMVQKSIVAKCNNIGKPVIIATQMMESMIELPTPTRAEINDIANAVIDGADALMLSGETAIGKYPYLVVEKMQQTIKSIEEKANIYNKFHAINENSIYFYSDCVVQTTCKLAHTIKADAIIGSTASGYTAFELAKNRPASSIYVFTDNKDMLKMFSLVWGIRAFYYDQRLSSANNMFEDMENILLKKGLLKKGHVCIHTGSLPVDKNQRSNMLKVSKIK